MNASIIVPIHNAEQYLEKCLLSLVNQTEKEIEIICIDDGSTDGSADILVKFEKQYSNIVVYRQKQQGVSVARAKGIDLAKGTYIGFCDSDDEVETDMYENMISYMETYKADMAVCGYKRIDKNGNEQEEMNHWGDGIIDVTENQEVLPMINTALWNKLLKAEIVKKHISFEKAPKIGEDMMFLLSIYPYIQKVYFSSNIYYRYYVREHSAMSYLSQEQLRDMFDAMIYVKACMQDDIYFHKKHMCAIFALMHVGISAPLRIAERERRKAICWIKAFLNEEFPEWRQNAYLKLFNRNMWKTGLYKVKVLQILYKYNIFVLYHRILIRLVRW